MVLQLKSGLLLAAAALLAMLMLGADVANSSSAGIENGLFEFGNGYGAQDGIFVSEPTSEEVDPDEEEANAGDMDDDDEDQQQQQAGDYNSDQREQEQQDFSSHHMLKSIYNANPLPSAAAAAVNPSSASRSSSGGVDKHRSYCNPPNPCPKGHNPKDNGCQEGVKDTSEWNRLDQEHNMRMGKCACDVEHMFSCPQGVPTVSVATAKQASQKEAQEKQKMQQQQKQQQQNGGGPTKRAAAVDDDEFEEVKKSPAIFI